MKLIVAYIQPHKLKDVKQALYKAQVHKMSVTNALGCGEQLGYEESYRGIKFGVDLLKKVRLEIAVNEDFVQKTIDAIISRKMEKEAKDLDISIESSHYLHGQYDWEICFVAENIKIAKKFCEIINRLYYKNIANLILMERIFSARKCGILNPDMEKLREFL